MAGESPFGDALKALGDNPTAHVGLVGRYDIATGDLKAAVAIKVHDGDRFDFSLGAEFTYEKATKKPAGFVGVIATF
jgi:hypothetical protein